MHSYWPFGALRFACKGDGRSHAGKPAAVVLALVVKGLARRHVGAVTMATSHGPSS